MIQHPFLDQLRQKIRDKNDKLAHKRMQWVEDNPYFYNQLINALKFVIEPESRVLHIRCSLGFILDALEPKYGVGLDDSSEQIKLAKELYPDQIFIHHNIEEPLKNSKIKGKFDYILISSVEDIVDIKAMLDNLHSFCNSHTRIIMVHYNFFWQPWVKLAEKLRLKIPQKLHNWLSNFDIQQLFSLCNYDVINSKGILLYPFKIPIISYILNRYFARLPFFRLFNFIRFTIARIKPKQKADCKVSVIIPCKNEAGNIEDAVKRIPPLGSQTEIIFCDDQSTDGTGEVVKKMIQKYPEKDIRLVVGPGICKSENVWVGFDSAKGDILMILDADLTVPPEELPYFYDAINQGTGEFINGSRLVYPQHEDAMKFFNVLGNKFFSVLFSYILSTRIKDTLCGTKVLWKKDYDRLKKYRGTWGIQDRWGDYELIFGAAKLNLKITDLPVHYLERIYGETKMTHRLKNGWIMLKMSLAALHKIKFHS